MPDATDENPAIRVTRLAPSPTGALHLGNARTFLVNWALARNAGWAITMRIEDLDTPRVKPWAIQQAADDLAWLGLDWDGDTTLQSTRLDAHTDAMRALAERGRVYPCVLTRSEIEAAASAPNEGDAPAAAFPRSVRPAEAPRVFDDPTTNWRLAIDEAPFELVDAFMGRATADPARTMGDAVVWTKRGQPAYQLAVVVDDAASGVTDVVRGNDLFDATGVQVLLYEALGLGEPPRYTHLPLVRGEDGRRLAKRHGDTRLSTYRDAGVPSEAVVGMAAFWSGVIPSREPMAAADFRAGFVLDRLPRTDVTFTEEDHRWLMSHARSS